MTVVQSIPDSQAECTGVSSPCLSVLTLLPKEEQTDGLPGVTLEWIQTLPPELKDAALLRLFRTVEAKPTLVEAFTLIQVLYRTVSGGTFTESADNVAARTGCDRKTILKGLEQAYNQNILDKNVRPGTSTEYFFKPESEWKPEPVVRNKDIRTKPLTEFPITQNTEPEEINLPSGEDDVNRVVRNKDYPETDTPTIWRRTEDATRYCQIPPIHDQATGVEIQRQMDEEGLTAQKVVSRAVAFSKVPLMLLETLGAIGKKLVEGFSHVELGSSELGAPVPVNVESALANLAGTMGRTTRDKSAPKLYGKGEDKIEYFQDSKLKEYGVNLNDENLINVAIAASSKDFEIATDCFLNWIKKQKTDDDGNIIKTNRLGNVERINPTQKFINAINYKWKPRGYDGIFRGNLPPERCLEKVAEESLQNASAYVVKQQKLEPSLQQMQKLTEALELGVIRELFPSGDGVLKVIHKSGHSEPWYDWLRVQQN